MKKIKQLAQDILDFHFDYNEVPFPNTFTDLEELLKSLETLPTLFEVVDGDNKEVQTFLESLRKEIDYHTE